MIGHGKAFFHKREEEMQLGDVAVFLRLHIGMVVPSTLYCKVLFNHEYHVSQ
jgi:hypothetical protein